jgi:hypothetical protein
MKSVFFKSNVLKQVIRDQSSIAHTDDYARLCGINVQLQHIKKC